MWTTTVAAVITMIAAPAFAGNATYDKGDLGTYERHSRFMWRVAASTDDAAVATSEQPAVDESARERGDKSNLVRHGRFVWRTGAAADRDTAETSLAAKPIDDSPSCACCKKGKGKEKAASATCCDGAKCNDSCKNDCCGNHCDMKVAKSEPVVLDHIKHQHVLR